MRHKKDHKNTWEVLCTLLLSKPASTTPDIITSHDATVSHPIAIVNEINHYFSNVGNVLASNIDNSMPIAVAYFLFETFLSVNNFCVSHYLP